MSTKRMLGIAIFGVVFIAAVIGLMMLTSYFQLDDGAFELPETPTEDPPASAETHDGLSLVEVTPETVQEVIKTLYRPESYSRDIIVEIGGARVDVSVSVIYGVTALRNSMPGGMVRRVIVTADTLYIWYEGDDMPRISRPGVGRGADEWQMIVTYEDVLELAPGDIIEAGFTRHLGELCIYAVYRSPLLGYFRRYYISVIDGLVIGATEHDETGALVYQMTAGPTGGADPTKFILPDGASVIPQP